MDLRQLRYFVKIVDLGSFSRASGVLYIAQSALSQRIAALEHELNCQLLTSAARGVTPTAAGRALYARAVRVLRNVDDIPDAVRLATDQPSGRVVIGIPVSVACFIATPLVRAVLDKFPGITLAFNELPSSTLPALLVSGQLDLALIFESDLVRGVESTALFDEDMVLVEASGSVESRPLEEVPLAALEGRRMALTPPPNSIRHLVDEACQSAGVHFELVAETSSPARLIDLVREGLAATVMPWSGLGQARHDVKLRVRPLGPPRLRRSVLLAHSTDLGVSDAAAAVGQLLPKVIQGLAKEADWSAIQFSQPQLP